MSATITDPMTGERVTASDVLSPEDYQSTEAVVVAEFPCDQFLTLRPCTDTTGYGICAQCVKAGLS